MVSDVGEGSYGIMDYDTYESYVKRAESLDLGDSITTVLPRVLVELLDKHHSAQLRLVAHDTLDSDGRSGAEGEVNAVMSLIDLTLKNYGVQLRERERQRRRSRNYSPTHDLVYGR